MRRVRCSEGRAVDGFTLIDVLVLIVLLSAVAASLTGIFSRMAQDSARALRERQAAALAEGLLAEVLSMPFSYCDAQDARAALATGAFLGGTGCATLVDGLGPEPGESRYGPVSRFDSVTDYNGFTMPGPGCAGICNRDGLLLNGPGSPLATCTARVNLLATALPGIAALDANGRPQALRIIVSVSCGNEQTALEAIRTRHAPNQI